jgi:hypothetical protein
LLSEKLLETCLKQTIYKYKGESLDVIEQRFRNSTGIPVCYFLHKSIQDIYVELEPGCATIISGLYKEGDTGHVLIAFKRHNNDCLLIDPSTGNSLAVFPENLTDIINELTRLNFNLSELFCPVTFHVGTTTAIAREARQKK